MVVSTVSALVLGSVTVSPAAPANPIAACPFAITAGGTYTVTQNLTASGTCITIAQPDGDSVTVNLNGFTIAGDGHGAAILAPNPGDKISVVGPGTITHFATAVDLSETKDVTVKRLQVVATSTGILVGQGSIYDSVVSGTTGSVGAIVAGAKSTITNVTATSNTGGGILVGSGSSVSQSTANDNSRGIVAGDKSLVKNSTANHNVDDGIQVGAGATVTQSTASNNGADGIAGNTKSNINKNVANDNGGAGIAVFCPATVQQNTAIDNTGDDINPIGSGCTLKKNVTSEP